MLNMFNPKKSFFKKKIKQVRNALWDIEFKLFKVRELREERRKQHDRAVEALDALDTKLKSAENTKETTEILTKQKAEQELYLKQVKGQLDALDEEINGIPQTETTPGYQGILAQIDAHRELLDMYQDYLKRHV
jgi:chromosome segregation ATPase